MKYVVAKKARGETKEFSAEYHTTGGVKESLKDMNTDRAMSEGEGH